MNDLPDEVLHLIFYETAEPANLSRVNHRLLSVSQDPFVRANYFITRHGELQAIYFALARGKLLTPRVLDILLASGAHLSRYLVQVAFHHFFHSHSHFTIKLPWVRNVSLSTFAYFLSLAAEKFGEIPRGKGEDDGAIVSQFIKEARQESQHVTWEQVRDIFETHNFIPFCERDPLFSQIPLALAIEPRLLPYAVANGFHMDAKYRDFVFRKMFERSAAPVQAHTEEIVGNVRELCRLDPSMFVTRTVAAEVCLEPKTNEAAYRALRQLDRGGDLSFTLRELIQDIIKLFLRVRAITSATTSQILIQLYTDFLAPSSTTSNLDPLVRRAMFLTVFAAEPSVRVSDMTERLAPLKLGPFTISDAADVLLSAFVEKPSPVLEYLRREGVSPSGRKPTSAEVRELAEEVAVRCLGRDAKGKTLKRLCDIYPNVKPRIVQAVLGDHARSVEEILAEGGLVQGNCAKLAKQMGGAVCSEGEETDEELEGQDEDEDEDEGGDYRERSTDDEEEDEDVHMWDPEEDEGASVTRDLGAISLEPLTTMIRRDENQGTRGRRRYYHTYHLNTLGSNSRLPIDHHSVARWIKIEFGSKSSVTAVFLTHAVVNGNHSVLNTYLHPVHGIPVPITLKHFRLMAALGTSCADYNLYERIKAGAPFYASEEDYISGSGDTASVLMKKLDKGKAKAIKVEPVEMRPVKVEPVSPPRGRKRPRRSAATAVSSYAVPDSDDEAITSLEDREGEYAEFRGISSKDKVKVKVKAMQTVSPLEEWVKALEEINKDEQRKYREQKKQADRDKGEGPKARVSKSDFFRSLTSHLRTLRDLEQEERKSRSGSDGQDGESDAEDDEYVCQGACRAKRRRTTA
ncbi:hypothetical protein FB45DRAFT_735982 [Roridomyces roridus]|uniref:Uncharacterized protein n=1 Tax=Roridomyces roridus TaxID=1738132 RepID=A0AAD7CBP9_9AGAR|nr:hypothetical protein FB45DRAFT_735982 [Roridomyces roridus]